MTDLEKGTEAFNGKDYSAAVKILLPLAEKGDAKAQGIMASMFENGHGVPQNQGEMIKWYKSSAQLGETQSQFKLARILFDRMNVDNDIITPHIWVNLATSNGLEDARSLKEEIEAGMSEEEIIKAQDAALELLKEYPHASNLSTLILKSDPA